MLNKQGHEGLTGLGRMAAVPFGILAPMLCLAAVGWFRRRYWGWVLGVTIIAINMAGDVGQNGVIGERLKGAVGVAIAGLLLTYMTRVGVRGYFRREGTARGS